MKTLPCLCFVSLLALALPVRAGERVLLNETFDEAYLSGGMGDGVEVESAQDLPHSVHWFLSYQTGPAPESANVVFSAGTNRGMTLRDVAQSGIFNVMAYFTDSRADAVHLRIGDSLSATFEITVKNPQSKRGGFVVGLMNSHGSQLVSPYYVYDDGATSKPFGGYTVDANLGTELSTQATGIFRRKPSETLYSLYHSDTRTNEGFVGASTGAALDLADGQTYEGVLKITRVNETENEIFFSLNGVEIAVLDPGADVFAFDTINFGYGGADAASSITLNNLRVVLRPSQEP